MKRQEVARAWWECAKRDGRFLLQPTPSEADPWLIPMGYTTKGGKYKPVLMYFEEAVGFLKQGDREDARRCLDEKAKKWTNPYFPTKEDEPKQEEPDEECQN